MKKLLNSKLRGELIVALVSFLGVVLSAAIGYYATLQTMVKQEVINQANKAAVEYITSLTQSVWAKNEEELIETRKLMTLSKARIMLYGTEHMVVSLSEFEKNNCTGLQTVLCRNAWKKFMAEFKKEVSDISYKGIESDIGIILLGESDIGIILLGEEEQDR